MFRRYNIVKFGKNDAFTDEDAKKIGEISVDPANVSPEGVFEGQVLTVLPRFLYFKEAYLEPVEPQ
jgi:hypothetical protein